MKNSDFIFLLISLILIGFFIIIQGAITMRNNDQIKEIKEFLNIKHVEKMEKIDGMD